MIYRFLIDWFESGTFFLQIPYKSAVKVVLKDRNNHAVWRYEADDGEAKNVPVPVYPDPDLFPMTLVVKGEMKYPPLLVQVMGIVHEPEVKK